MEYIDQLKQLANENRKRIINMIYKAKSGHEGGSLSIIDMLTAIYELDVNFNENPNNPNDMDPIQNNTNNLKYTFDNEDAITTYNDNKHNN